MGYLIFDIETVPDSRVWVPPKDPPDRLQLNKAPTKDAKAFLDLVMKTLAANEREIHLGDLEKAFDTASKLKEFKEAAEQLSAIIEERKEPERAPFAPIYAHRPVAIGFMQLDDAFQVTAYGCVGTATYGDNEAHLLRDFGTFAQNGDPVLVGWNSKAFDMPVILQRSMIRGVPQPWYDKNKRYRYDESNHIDLKQAMTEYGLITSTRPNFSLDRVAKTIGLPGKMGVDGSQVADMYAEGKHAEIALYCQDDVAQTAFVLLRFLLLRGRMRRERYTEAATSMLQAWRAAHPGEEIKVDESLLLLPEQ